MKTFQTIIVSLLLSFVLSSFLGASSLRTYQGTYRDKNLSLKIKARFSSSIVRRKGRRVGRVSRYIIFKMLPNNGREIMNAQIYFKKTFYKFQFGKDELKIDVKNTKQPYKMLLIYQAKKSRIKITKKRRLKFRTVYRKIVLKTIKIPGKRRGRLLVKVYQKGRKTRK